MSIFFFVLVSIFTMSAFGLSAIDKAVSAAGIRQSDSLETKIDKALWLLNEKRYFYPEKTPGKLPPPFDVPYQLDSMRTPEQILEQKLGGSCGSSALAFAAMLKASGVPSKDIQIVNSVVNKDLAIICPKAGAPRVQNAQSGASGHVFVAIRFPNEKWKIIDSIDGSRNYERADWYPPEQIQQRMKSEAIEIPQSAFKKLPPSTYGSGLTVFQSWSLEEVPMHTYEQRYDLIASGDLKQSPAICRFTAPAAPPKVFVDKGACPFECCTYRAWSVEKDTDLFDAVDGKKIIGKAKKGQKLTAITGEVHTVPFKVKTNDGNEIYLLTYQGEGFWKVWEKGKVRENVEEDWKPNQAVQSTWWVQIKLNNGTKGWTKETKNFGNQDGCG